jgi:hypothetical protein
MELLFIFQELFHKTSRYTSFLLCHDLIYSTIDVGEGNNNIRFIILITIRCQIGLMWCIKNWIGKLHCRVQGVESSIKIPKKVRKVTLYSDSV